MNRTRFFTVAAFSLFISCACTSTNQVDYSEYHSKIYVAEELVSNENYVEALKQYERIFEKFEFAFLRDQKIATQLYFFTGQKEKGFRLLKKSIASGWQLQELKNNPFLIKHLNYLQWGVIEEQYDSLHQEFLNRIDIPLRDKVHLMYNKDQELAYQTSKLTDDQAQEAFLLKTFSNHSQKQLKLLVEILKEKGYPGEFLIGNNFWSATIISHHNSIAPNVVKNDTLYDFIKPKLLQALTKGFISPYEFALMEDWKSSLTSDFNTSTYGYLNAPNASNILKINASRIKIGLRTVELRNKLVDIENKIGINLYLPDWIDGKIQIF